MRRSVNTAWENTLPSSISWCCILCQRRAYLAKTVDGQSDTFSPRNEVYFSFACRLLGILGKCLYSQRANSLLVWITPFPWLFLLVLLFSSFTKGKGIRMESYFEREKRKWLGRLFPVSYWAWTRFPNCSITLFVHSIRILSHWNPMRVLSLGSVREGGLS